MLKIRCLVFTSFTKREIRDLVKDRALMIAKWRLRLRFHVTRVPIFGTYLFADG